MSQKTKDYAKIKLDKMNFKLVSPEDGEWKDYSSLEFNNYNFKLVVTYKKKCPQKKKKKF